MVATVTFAGIPLDVAPYHIETAEGLSGSPEIRRYEYPRAGRNGVMVSPSLTSGRTFAFTIRVNHPTPATYHAAMVTLMDAIAEAFNAPADTVALTFNLPGAAIGGTDVGAWVHPVRWTATTDTLYHKGAGLVALELFAGDPLVYSVAETSTVISLAVSGGGFTFPEVFPLIFAGGGSSGTANIVNAGNAPSPPRFRIDGPVTDPRIRSDTADKDLLFDLTVDSGDWVDINVQNRSVLLNGTASRYSALIEAEWFDLAPGSNTIRFSGSSAGAPTLTVYSRSAWL